MKVNSDTTCPGVLNPEFVLDEYVHRHEVQLLQKMKENVRNEFWHVLQSSNDFFSISSRRRGSNWLVHAPSFSFDVHPL
jgi:hypothetical protein